jgi:hypothetical protein
MEMMKHVTDEERNRKLLAIMPKARRLGAALARYARLEHLMDESAAQAVFFLWKHSGRYRHLEGTALEGAALWTVKWSAVGWLKQQRRRTHTSLDERIQVPGDEAFTGDELLARTAAEDTDTVRAEARLSFEWLWKHAKGMREMSEAGRPYKALLTPAQVYLLHALEVLEVGELSGVAGVKRARMFGLSKAGGEQVRHLVQCM